MFDLPNVIKLLAYKCFFFFFIPQDVIVCYSTHHFRDRLGHVMLLRLDIPERYRPTYAIMMVVDIIWRQVISNHHAYPAMIMSGSRCFLCYMPGLFSQSDNTLWHKNDIHIYPNQVRKCLPTPMISLICPYHDVPT